ncbi:MAG: SLC13 family permease [Phycisphaerae bacterium]
MTEQVYVLIVLAAALGLFLWERWRYDIVAVAALLALALPGIVPTERVFSGFANPAVVTVVAVLIIGRALTNAGVVDLVSRLLLGVGGGLVLQLALLCTLITLLSAFLNNVGALTLLLPVALRMARSRGVSPSLYLMPLAFCSLLGGMTTLIGTPPNLLIADFRARVAGQPFGVFDFTPVGAAVALTGVMFIVLVGWRLLPRRAGAHSTDELFEISSYVTELSVPDESPAIGTRIRDLAGTVKDVEFVIGGIIRNGDRVELPTGVERLAAGDRLIVEAAPDAIGKLTEAAKLKLVGDEQRLKEPLRSEDVSLVEAIVTPTGYLVNRTAQSVSLRWRFGVNLLAVARQGARLKRGLKQVRFRAGDILLLQVPTERLSDALTAIGCLPLAGRDIRLGAPRRLLMVVLVFVAAILLAAFGVLRADVAFMAAALIYVLSSALTLRELYDSVEWPIVVLLGAMIPVGDGLDSSGAAALLAGQIVRLADVWPPWALVALVLVIAMFLSDVINNAATVVVLAPVAIGLAHGLGHSPDPYLMAVAVGASCAFLTPIGHQSNTLVMSPGGYRFGDYWKLGLPLEVLVPLVAVPVLLWAWPLKPT